MQAHPEWSVKQLAKQCGTMWKPKVNELLARKIGDEGHLIRPIEVACDAGIREATICEWMSGELHAEN